MWSHRLYMYDVNILSVYTCVWWTLCVPIKNEYLKNVTKQRYASKNKLNSWLFIETKSIQIVQTSVTSDLKRKIKFLFVFRSLCLIWYGILERLKYFWSVHFRFLPHCGSFIYFSGSTSDFICRIFTGKITCANGC